MVNDIALFLYGFDIDSSNYLINFKKVSLGSELTATLNFGNYTASQLMKEIKRAMELADGVNTYTVTLDRTVANGRSNRMRISTSGSFLSILFGSGTNAGASPAALIGALAADYTGQTSYSFDNNAGKILIPDMPTYNFQTRGSMNQNDGVVNVTSTGIKETLVFAQMEFFEGEWKYITNIDNSDQYTQWEAFLQYATKQLQFEFQPSINEDPTVAWEATLEKTPEDQHGLKYKLKQMMGEGLYRIYQTGLLEFRIVVV